MFNSERTRNFNNKGCFQLFPSALSCRSTFSKMTPRVLNQVTARQKSKAPLLCRERSVQCKKKRADLLALPWIFFDELGASIKSKTASGSTLWISVQRGVMCVDWKLLDSWYKKLSNQNWQAKIKALITWIHEDGSPKTLHLERLFFFFFFFKKLCSRATWSIQIRLQKCPSFHVQKLAPWQLICKVANGSWSQLWFIAAIVLHHVSHIRRQRHWKENKAVDGFVRTSNVTCYCYREKVGRHANKSLFSSWEMEKGEKVKRFFHFPNL